MVYLSEKDFDKLAAAVSDDYVSNGASLNASILKLAGDMGLNPAQVKQLVWRSNTATHLKLFEKKAEDKVVEFEVADPATILGTLYAPAGEEPVVAKTASYDDSEFYSDIPEAADVTLRGIQEREKVASWNPRELSTTGAAKRYVDATVMAETAVREVQDKLAQAQIAYKDSLVELDYELSKLAHHPSRNHEVGDFAHEAVSLYGSDVLPILNDLELKVTDGMMKTATAADENSVLHVKLAEVIDNFSAAVKHAYALKYLKDRLANHADAK